MSVKRRATFAKSQTLWKFGFGGKVIRFAIKMPPTELTIGFAIGVPSGTSTWGWFVICPNILVQFLTITRLEQIKNRHHEDTAP